MSEPLKKPDSNEHNEGFNFSIDSQLPFPQPESSRVQRIIDETETDVRIGQLEAGIQGLEAQLRKKQHLLPPDMHEKLFEPFAIIAKNSHNPYKNALMRKRHFSGELLPEVFADMFSKKHFSYRFDLRTAGLSAAYIVPLRVMSLQPNFDPLCMADLLLAYHEAVHVDNELIRLQFFKTAREYQDFYTSNKSPTQSVSILIDEVVAMICHAEVTNALLDNSIRRAALADSAITLADMTQALGGNPAMENRFRAWIDYMTAYFRLGGAKNAKEFEHFVEQGLLENGVRVFVEKKGGRLMELHHKPE